jgi:hypothetical protein
MAAQQPELVAQLRSAAAAEREASFAALLTLEQKHGSTTGAESEGIASTFEACAIPLCELLLKPVAEVDAAEFRRAALVLTAIGGVAHTRVGAVLSDIRKPINFWAVLSGTPVGQPWTPPRSALGVALAKDPASLTAEDALTVAVGFSTFLTPMSTSNGMEPAFEAVGITFLDFAAAYFPVRSPRPAPTPPTHTACLSLFSLSVSLMFLASFSQESSPRLGQVNFLLQIATPSDDRNLVLVPLMLGLLKAPEALPEFAVASLCFAFADAVMGRPAVAALAIEQGAISTLMATLRKPAVSELMVTAGFARVSRAHTILTRAD